MAYHGAAIMTSAQYEFWPFEKFKRFNRGKGLIEEAVKKDYDNPEIRWIRYIIQKNAPSFLGYGGNLKEDYDFLQKYLNSNLSSADPELKSFISESLR